MSIKISNVTKLYGKQRALDNVSFEVQSGKIVGLLGPNGAAKTTIMKIITGIIPQTEGEVSVEGIDVMENPIEVKKCIGYLPEHNPLYLDMYVKEYLDFMAGMYKLPHRKERIAEMIEITGLVAEQKKKIGALSKGYRQRVGLAQALIHNPKALILDEPTTGLDPNQIVEIRELISNIGKAKTVILSTHIMQEVKAICDQVIIINQGKIVAYNDVDTIQNLMSEGVQTVEVEFAVSVDKSLLESIEGATKVETAGTNKWLISAKGEGDLRVAISQFALSKQIPTLSMTKVERSLEDVFRQLTKNSS